MLRALGAVDILRAVQKRDVHIGKVQSLVAVALTVMSFEGGADLAGSPFVILPADCSTDVNQAWIGLVLQAASLNNSVSLAALQKIAQVTVHPGASPIDVTILE